MTESGDRQGIENKIHELKGAIDKYITGKQQPTPTVVADLMKAIHEMGDHLVELHRRVEAIEEMLPEWTTRGWSPPPGSDSPH